MDIFFEATEINAENLSKAINEFGFSYLKLTPKDLLDKNGFIKLGREPVRIDLFCDLPGIEFAEVDNAAFDYEEDDVKIKVIHINHLIRNKEAVGRLQDLDDVKK